MSEDKSKLRYYDRFIRETKMDVLSSKNRWISQTMHFNEEEGAWEVDRAKLGRGTQQ